MSFHFRAALNLLAGFLIGMHLAVFFHEFGHALGSELSGLPVFGIVMITPFPAGWVEPKMTASVMHVWGGVVVGSVLAAVPLVLARQLRGRPALRFCALLTAAFCFAHNGFYFMVGGLAPFGDAADMIHLGAPRWMLPLLGVPLVLAGPTVLARAIRMVGLPARAPAWTWVATVEAGLLLVPAAMIVPMLFSANERSLLWPMALLLGAFAVSFFVAAVLARRAAAEQAENPAGRLAGSWKETLNLWAGVVAVLTIEWFACLHPR